MILNRGVLISFFQNSYAFQAVNLYNGSKFRSGVDQGNTKGRTKMQGHQRIREKSNQRTSVHGSSVYACSSWLERTQKATSHSNGPMTAPQGGPVPGVPVAGGAEVALTAIPPMTISTTSVMPSTNPTALFWEYILVQVGQKYVLIQYTKSELTAYTLLPKII